MKFESTFIGRPSTRRVQLSLWRTNLEPYINVSDSQLNETFIRSLVNNWSHLKPNTIQQLISIANRYVTWKTGQKLDCSRVSRIVSRSAPKTEKAIWTVEQTKKALDIARHTNKALYQMLLLGLNTGARSDELKKLTLAELDFNNRMIHIKDSKNGHPRKVPMTKATEAIISQIVASGIAQSNWNRPLKRLCAMAEVPEITFHALRHMFVTRALESGLSPKRVSAITGHGVKTLVDTYWHITHEVSTDDVVFMEE